MTFSRGASVTLKTPLSTAGLINDLQTVDGVEVYEFVYLDNNEVLQYVWLTLACFVTS